MWRGRSDIGEIAFVVEQPVDTALCLPDRDKVSQCYYLFPSVSIGLSDGRTWVDQAVTSRYPVPIISLALRSRHRHRTAPASPPGSPRVPVPPCTPDRVGRGDKVGVVPGGLGRRGPTCRPPTEGRKQNRFKRLLEVESDDLGRSTDCHGANEI